MTVALDDANPGRTRTIIALVTLVYAALLSLWGFAQLIAGVNVCCADVGTLQHPFYFYPYISMAVAEAVRALSGVGGSVLLGQIILPAAVFWLLILIFHRHVNLLWAVALALLAVSSIDGYPFHRFLEALSVGNWPLVGSDQLPELLYFPVPAFSTFYFLSVFYLATQPGYMGVARATLITIAFALMVYVNALDAFFALAFWIIFSPVKWARQRWPSRKLIFCCLLQAAIILAVVIRALSSSNIDPDLNPPAEGIHAYYAIAYFGLPAALMVVLFFIQRIDPYELFYNFRHVYVIMLAEVAMILLSSTGILPLNMHIARNRIVQFFAHTYYYVPVIYYASRPMGPRNYGSEGRPWARTLMQGLNLIFKGWSPIYLAVAIILLCGYNGISGVKNFLHNQRVESGKTGP